MKRLAMLLTALMLWATVASPMVRSVTAAASGGAGPSNPIQKWKLSANSNHPAVIGKDGMIYLGGDSLYAMTPAGSMKWTSFIGEGGEFYADATPAIGSNGTIYAAFMSTQWGTPIADRDSYLTAFNPDGTLKWKYSTGSIVGSQPAVGPDGTVYISNYNSVLFAISPDGFLKWSTKLGTDTSYGSTVLVSLDGSSLYTSCDKGLCALAAADGSLKWSDQKTGASPYVAPNGTIYSLSKGDLVMNSPDGTQLKMLNLKAQNFTVGKDGTIYAGVGSAMNAFTANGDLIWSVPTAGGTGQAVVGSDGTVYFGSYDEHVYAVDASGRVKWLYFVGTGYVFHYDENRNVSYYELGINPKVALGADGTVYVNSNNLYASPGEEAYSSQIIALGDQGGTPANKRIIPDPSYVKATTGTFEVTVMDEGGYNKESNVYVNVRDQNGQLMSTVQTDESGKAVLKLSKEGIYAIEIEKEGNQSKPLQARLLLGQTNRIDMQLHSIKDGAIHFTITSTIDHAPIAGAQVVLRNLGTQAVIASSTDAKGEVYFRNVPEGNYILRSVKDGFDPVESEWVSPRPEQQDFGLEMSPPVTTVKFVNKNGDPDYVQYHFQTDNTGGTTNGSGIASFYNLPLGTYKLAIVDEHYRDGQVVTFAVTDKQRDFVVVLNDNHKVISTGSGASFAENVVVMDDNHKVIGTGSGASFAEKTNSNQTTESSGNIFKDIKNHWAENQITRLSNLNIVNGFPDGTFRPEEIVTREQFITLIVKTMGYPLNADASSFSDVSKDSWSYSYIEAAIKANILSKEQYGDKFNPGGAMPRIEMAIIVARALHLEPDVQALFFKDKEQITTNPELVGATVKAGIISGFPDETFRPHDTLTRAQACIVLINSLDYLNKSNSSTTESSFIPRNSKNIVEFKPEVIELTNDTAKKVSSLSGNGNTLIIDGKSDETAALKPGDIFRIPPTEENPIGLAKKVVSVKFENNQTIVETTEPTIDELVTTIDVSKIVNVTSTQFIPEIGVQVKQVANSGLVKIQSAEKNPKLSEDNMKLSNDDLVFSFNFSIPKKETSEEKTSVLDEVINSIGTNVDGKSKNHRYIQTEFKDEETASVSLSGNFVLQRPQVITDVDYSFFSGFKSARFEFITGQSAKINLTGKVEITKDATMPLGKLLIPVAGPLFVVGELNLVIHTDGSAELTVEASEQFSLDLGFTADKNGINKISNVTFDSEFHPLELNGEISASISLDPNLYISILSVSIAGIENSLGFRSNLQGSIDVHTDTESWESSSTNVCLHLNNELFAESKATLKILLETELDLLSASYPISKFDKCNVVDKISIFPGQLELAPGETKQISVTIVYKDGTDLILPLNADSLDSNNRITYASSNPLITVNDRGVVTVSASAKPGDKASIKVSTNDIKTSMDVIVKSAEGTTETGPDNTDTNNDSTTDSVLFQGEVWKWSDPGNDATRKIEKDDQKDALMISAPSNNVISPTSTNLPTLTKTVTGDFAFSAHVKASAAAVRGRYGGAGIILKGQNGYVRLEKGTYGEIQMIAAENGSFIPTSYTASNQFESDDVYLKLERKGDTLIGSYSTDGTNWNQLATAKLHISDENQIGVHLYNSSVIGGNYQFEGNYQASYSELTLQKSLKSIGLTEKTAFLTVKKGQTFSISITNHGLPTPFTGGVVGGQTLSLDNPADVFVGAIEQNGNVYANNPNRPSTWFMCDTPIPGNTATTGPVKANLDGTIWVGYNSTVPDNGSFDVTVTVE